MIFDHRTYTAHPIRMGQFLELYARVGLPLQRHYLGEPFGFFQAHIGELNRIVHLWRYASLADRETRRDAMEADPRWEAYRREVMEGGFLIHMWNEILRPVVFFDPDARPSTSVR